MLSADHLKGDCVALDLHARQEKNFPSLDGASFFRPIANKRLGIKPSTSIGQDIKQASQAIGRSPCTIGRHPSFRIGFKDNRSFYPLMCARRGWPLKHHVWKPAPDAAPVLVGSHYSNTQLEDCQGTTKYAGVRGQVRAALDSHQKRTIRPDFQHLRVTRIVDPYTKSRSSSLQHRISQKNHFAICIHDKNKIIVATQRDVFNRKDVIFATDFEWEECR